MAYATWNPSDKGAGITLSGGDLTAATATSSDDAVRATSSKSSGKWYWEITIVSGGNPAIGVANASADLTSYLGGTSDSLALLPAGNILKNGSIVGSSAAPVPGDIVSIAWDADAGTVTFKVNNASSATISGANVPTGALFPACGGSGGIAATTMTANFGASAFTYTPPVGHSGLQDAAVYEHAMLGGVTSGGDSTVILQPLYINMLAGVSAGASTAVVFEAATRYEHAMLAGLSAGTDTAVSAPRTYAAAALPAHTISASTAPTSQLAETLPAHTIFAEFATGSTLADSLVAHTLDGVSELGAVASLDDSVAPHSLLADGPWYADNALAVHVSDASLLGGGVSSLDETLAPVSIEASAIPDFNGVASNVVPLHSADITYLAGSIGIADVIAASILLDASGFSGSVASLDQNIPAHTLEAVVYPAHDAVASLVLLPHTLSASVVEAVSAAFKAWALNTHKLALTEYTAFQFNSFAVFKGKVYAAGSAGVMELAAQGTDNGTSIAATVRTGQHAFGTSFLKRVPRIYVGYKATGDMEFRTITGEDGVRSYLLTYNGNPNLHQRRVPVGLGPKSPYWQFEFVNRSGADFTIDHVLAHSAKVTHRRVM